MRNIDPTFGDLVELRAMLLRFAIGKTRRNQVAEDLVQTTFLKMFANRHRAPTDPKLVKPWAFVILLNVFREGIRSTQREFSHLGTWGHKNYVALQNEDGSLDLAAPDNPETQTYCRQVLRKCLGLDPSLLLDPDANGQRWDGGVAKTATERRKRYRARLALQPMVAA